MDERRSSEKKNTFPNTKQKKRTFAGKIDNFESKEERSFMQKALKAYLKGAERFRHKYDLMGSPSWYITPVKWV